MVFECCNCPGLQMRLKMKEKKMHKEDKDFWANNGEMRNELPDESYIDNCDLNDTIAKVMAKQKSELTANDKKLLGKQITRSISTLKIKKIIVTISSAAVLLVIIGISAIIFNAKNSQIRVYAQHIQSINESSTTRLILSGKKEVLIESNDSKIAYAGNGNEVKVDTNIVSQSVDENKIVYNTVIVPYGKRTQITLSDNSIVWLNSGSKLIYPARFATEKREVYLEGEAIFEVSHNKLRPFHVVTSDIEVKVLGTVFDLSAYSDDKTTSTVLENGSVEMKDLSTNIFSSSKVTMIPGTMAVYSKDGSGITQSKVDVKQYTSWRDGYISCEKQTLGNILKKISRNYNVSIQVNDKSLENETFTGNLDLRNSAQQVLAILAEFINVKIDKTDNQILITRI